MSQGEINELMQILSEWSKTLDPEAEPPFADAKDMYSTIDACQLGHIPWQSFKVSFDGEVNEDDAPWKQQAYDVWFRDPKELLKAQLGNKDFEKEMDFAPKEVVDRKTGHRQYQDFMSGQWAWRQAVRIIQSIFIILMSCIRRISCLRIQIITGQPFAQLFLEATRPRFQ
jgi:hypothetical protein